MSQAMVARGALKESMPTPSCPSSILSLQGALGIGFKLLVEEEM